VSPANPFNALAGTYNGLFYETNGVALDSAGFMKLTLATNGIYSGYALVDGGSNLFSGQFAINGGSTLSITRTNGSLGGVLALDVATNSTQSISGTVSNGSWTAVLNMDRATFSDSSPTMLAGLYTLQIPGSGNASSAPDGNAYATVTVDLDGTATMSGKLADGTSISQAVSIAQDGVWPMYVPLYSGKGCLLSWITFTNKTTSKLEGTAAWVKDSSAGGTYYASGFAVTGALKGSDFIAPPAGTRIISLTTGNVILSGGNLSTPITNSITLNVDNTITVDPSATNGLAISINTTNGTFTGQFTDPSTSATRLLKGVFLQSSTNAVGYFLGTDETGAILLH
jgi:hypothetical protein